MKQSIPGRAVRTAVAAMFVAVSLAGCAKSYAEPPGNEKPAIVEQISGSPLKRITLSEKANTRLGVKTAPVGEVAADGQQVKTVPYSALLYDAAGKTWVYTSPQRLVFVRHEVKVIRIEKDKVLVSEGPEIGTQVVTVAVAELYGAEAGVGK